MASDNTPNNKVDDPLYNSRLIKNYLEYCKEFHTEIDINSLLSHAEITNYELEDPGHWFSQRQVDQFHEILVEKTGDSNISRKVGRFSVFSKASGAVRQYALGFMSPAAVYWVAETLGSRLTRASIYKTRKLGSNKIEILATPKPGVSEKSYQCDNRVGLLEAMSKLFTNKFAKIEHPTCIHKGGDLCHYIITWEKTPSLLWKRVRNYSFLFGMLVSLGLFFVLPLMPWAIFVLLCVLLTIIFSFYSEHLEKKDLTKTIETQGDAAKDLLDEINLRYNNALLVQEIGQATSMFLDIQKLLKSVMDIMKERLDFDRGGIWLANKEKTRLIYNVGYGYRSEIENLLRNTDFHLDRQRSRGVVVQAFKQQKHYLVNNINEIKKDLSKRSLEFVQRIGAQSFICVPVVYEGESLGVLLVDNLKSKKPLSQSEISLLMGIAPQIAISTHNAISYQRLQETKEREHKLRKLFEKYVPAPIIKKYVDPRETDLFRVEELAITAMFLDIRGFTSSSEPMDAREVVSFLNDYFERCSLVISEENGHINKYTGDGFFAIFGAPESLEHHAASALNAATQILKLSSMLKLGARPIEVGIGISTGKAILGNIGSQSKIEYTAIGDIVNMAARLQEISKRFLDYPIIMGKEVWLELSGHPFYEAIKSLGEHSIRGKKQSVELFGYISKREHHFPMNQADSGFIPLQRIKGV